MLLEASCHCGAVHYSCQSRAPYPYALCYCSICRKTAGGGGYAINLHAEFATLQVTGQEHIGVYRPFMDHPARSERSPGERHFCKLCGSALWVWDPRWPELLHPHASAVDSELPIPPERIHALLDSKAAWVPVPPASPSEPHFGHYPQETLMDWHHRLGLVQD